MEETWAKYNTLLDAVTELEIPSEKANRWMQTVNRYENIDLSEDESQLFEKLLPDWHRDFLQSKHIPRYAIKTSLARLVCKEEDAKDLWNDAALFCMRNSPATLKIIHFSMLAYPLIDLAIMRRQLCIGVIAEIRKGNLKPYFFPESLESRGLNGREKLQEYINLPFTDQVTASIEIHELGNALNNKESFTKLACNLWQRYYDKARIVDDDISTQKENSQSTYDKNEGQKKNSGNRHAQIGDAAKAFRKKYPNRQITPQSVWWSLPSICSDWVEKIEVIKKGQITGSKAIMKFEHPWEWRAFKAVFNRYIEENPDI